MTTITIKSVDNDSVLIFVSRQNSSGAVAIQDVATLRHVAIANYGEPPANQPKRGSQTGDATARLHPGNVSPIVYIMLNGYFLVIGVVAAMN
jgi:hypothetical protein